MKKIVLTVITLLGLSIFTFNTGAMSAMMYELQPWNGAGSASVSFDGKYSEFVKVMYNEREVDKTNYTVEERQGKIDITIKEEYLRELDLTNGDYFFYAYFTKENVELENINASFDAEQAEIIFESNPFERMSEADLVSFRITYGEEEIDPSKYTVTKEGAITTVTFEKEFLETFPSGKSFACYSKYKKYTYFTVLKLSVAMEETQSQQTQTDSTEPIQQPSESPKTGYEEKEAIQPFVLVLLAAAGCMIALEGTRKINKED